MSDLEIYRANKQARLDEIESAMLLPEKYSASKDSIVARNNAIINYIDGMIAYEEAKLAKEDAKTNDPDFESLKVYGENLDLDTLKEIKTIVDDADLTEEQKHLLIKCKGGKC